jgi:hypothetical protein
MRIWVHVVCDDHKLRHAIAEMIAGGDDVELAAACSASADPLDSESLQSDVIVLAALGHADLATITGRRSGAALGNVVGFCLSREQADAYRRMGIVSVVYSDDSRSTLRDVVRRASARSVDRRAVYNGRLRLGNEP